MAIGTLTANVVVDQAKTPHYGRTDPVTGHVTLLYEPKITRENRAAPPDLFGPLKLTVCLSGQSKTKIITRGPKSDVNILRNALPLFSVTTTLHEGPFHAVPNQTHKFPFTLQFPSSVDRNRTEGGKADTRFDRRLMSELPPTFHCDHFSNRFTAWTEYHVNTVVQMPGIDIKTTSPQTENSSFEDSREPEIDYEPRLITRPIHAKATKTPAKFTKTVQLQKDPQLLPLDARPKTFKEKMKFAVNQKDFPKASLDLTCTYPKHIHPGEKINFSVQASMPPDWDPSLLKPDIHLEAFSAALIGHATVRHDCEVMEGRVRIFQFLGRKEDLPTGPFDKEKEMKKTMVMRAPRHAPVSFTAMNLVWKYEWDIEFTVAVARKRYTVKERVDVTVKQRFKEADEEASSGLAARASDARDSSSSSYSQEEIPAVAGPSRKVDRSHPPAYGEQ
ncbi:hypothetical protein KC340_g11350 [Hortaea werneckii]|nr:hypothetical protein KC342_g11669 [Hortaea werneckii]KAI7107733.1 hypothetical protein KC339_g2131 [Hortaea werneckii]KAI7227800.1 hypothetical protein KC365_g8750 [Hortaea werneckii]KAI7307517.1 hypothetical protein KC340_g11350 [Hortaea werneckii]KAI7378720.1 hypothetical protein KC328_g13749 [Hortaea werneckii]